MNSLFSSDVCNFEVDFCNCINGNDLVELRKTHGTTRSYVAKRERERYSQASAYRNHTLCNRSLLVYEKLKLVRIPPSPRLCPSSSSGFLWRSCPSSCSGTWSMPLDAIPTSTAERANFSGHSFNWPTCYVESNWNLRTPNPGSRAIYSAVSQGFRFRHDSQILVAQKLMSASSIHVTQVRSFRKSILRIRTK